MRLSRPLPLQLLIVVLALAAQPAVATTHWRRPAAIPAFATVRPELQRLADSEGRQRRNHFCAVVRDVREPPSTSSEGDSQELVVHWREGRRILSYGPGDGGPVSLERQDAGATIDLARDVVATRAQIGGSTTRVTRAVVDALIAHCRVSGTRYVITRRSRRR